MTTTTIITTTTTTTTTGKIEVKEDLRKAQKKCFQRGFIAQSVKHRTGITEVHGFEPHWSLRIFFWPLFVTA